MCLWYFNVQLDNYVYGDYENCEVCERSLKRFGVPSVGVKSSEFADSALLTWGILILVCFMCYFLFNNNSHVRHYLFYFSFFSN